MYESSASVGGIQNLCPEYTRKLEERSDARKESGKLMETQK